MNLKDTYLKDVKSLETLSERHIFPVSFWDTMGNVAFRDI